MERRRLPARIGIVLLNILAPGLGLLRLGAWKAALVIYSVAVLFLLSLNLAPPLHFGVLALVVIATLGTYVLAILLSWVLSRAKSPEDRWYSRWYSVVGAMLLAFGVNWIQSEPQFRLYRAFYMPAESMAPTLLKNDRFIAYMRPAPLRRGDLVLVPNHQGELYLKRIAGLAGDRIALRDGQVLLNGKRVAQTALRSEQLTDGVLGSVAARRLTERFPGEALAHEIYDLGETAGDQMEEELVRPDHIFLLGDNRDRSADSRFSKNVFGLEQVPVDAIAGYPLYFSWGSSKALGTPLHAPD